MIPRIKISYVDSWMFERNYGGKRGHEGTDIMAEKNTPGYYPVVSMTDGVVTEKGWLEKGGWRMGSRHRRERIFIMHIWILMRSLRREIR